MLLDINQLQNLISEKWSYVEENNKNLAVISGEHIILEIEHCLYNENLECKQLARIQLLASAPEMAKALADILDTSTNIIVASQDENALAAFHEAYHALKKVMGQIK